MFIYDFFITWKDGDIFSSSIVVRNYEIKDNALFLYGVTEESIKETVLHELAHVFVTLETGEDHGHDAVFKAMCARIGTSNDKTYHNNLKTIVPVENQHKYAIYCKSCRKFVCGRSRACKLTQTPEYYESHCCHSGLKVVQNW